MKHPNISELENFVNGKLDSKQLLEMDEHVCGCAQCRAAISNMFVSKKMALDLGALLLGANDCPEYEQLSAYVENELDTDQAKAMQSHVNSCEPCTRDVSRMAELRSHALMRPSVTVAPGMSKQAARTATPIWKRALAGMGAVGVVAFSAYMFFGLLKMSNQTAPVAKAPIAAKQEVAHQANLPEKPINIIPGVDKPTVIAARPEILLNDGNYRIIRENGKLQMAKAGDGSPRTALEVRIAASINEKLQTGKVKLDEPYQVSMTEFTVRSNGANNSSEAIAPKLIEPSDKVIFSSNPTLKWSKIDMASSYKVTVYDKTGRILIDQTTDKTSMMAPTSLPRGGVYQWRVGVRRSESDKWAMSAASNFAVLSDHGYNTIQKVRSQMPGSHLALGVAYESCGLYSEARQEYAAARRANFGSALANKLR
ncbi:MAG: zf-HC2 domain-containing protein [Armatimonadetes bacterium]|nr:zf-HC2 domain-containing protein [Armatimonadota bacterium]